MKLIRLFGVTIAGLALSAVASQAQLSLNFASTSGSTIQFNGAASSFQFSATGSQWQIGSESGGTGSAINLFGLVANGPFNYGAITTITLPGLIYQYANVTGPFGGLVIDDGAGNSLTGSVNWEQVATYNYAGAINGALEINVTGMAYSGSNPDLVTFVAEGPASMDLTFQFSPGMTLSQLTVGSGAYATSYSGSLSVVPEPTTAGCLLLGLCALACCQRFTKNRRS